MDAQPAAGTWKGMKSRPVKNLLSRVHAAAQKRDEAEALLMYPPPKRCHTQREVREARCTCHASSSRDKAPTLQAPGPWARVSEEPHPVCHLF